jgi:hypothetical protein
MKVVWKVLFNVVSLESAGVAEVADNVPPPPPAQNSVAVVESEAGASSPQQLQSAEEFARKLLKALHVCARYEPSMRKPLPANVDFFGKSLLGLTSISGFSDTLSGALRSVGYYVNVSVA